MVERPTGAVTFLFTDIEGSTLAWEERPDVMAADLEVYDSIVRQAIESHGGFVFATGGDSFSAAFTSPSDALAAAVEAQRGLTESECPLRVRMGVHSGEAVERDGNYFGPALDRTARLMSVGHGEQILASTTFRELVSSSEFEFVDLGEHRLADLSTPTQIAQVVAPTVWSPRSRR
jgi:class 3 adenylate cyclase